ncbi:hypothetical protein FPRO04_03389 [Fusarium proliferatum]|nr:hypothetical protein FPRO03_12699 [Fusarium proliferatum]KAG4269729.1 hypothetical protein FPRO04_03389 [Fusarium proliferatum]
MFAKVFTFASLASLASAHMLMANPKPYGSPDNSPLLGDGSNFPCKGEVNDGAGDNVYKQGSTQQLSFTGQAVHGGGSCQISLTTDKNPTKNSVWKVIKSIEGGCPAKGQEGNMGENADAADPYKYDFTIPKELAAGEYTLAWTWFNKVGNREMYMNCAAVTIEGSGGSKDHLDTLPDMFVGNIGNGCGTEPDTDLQFPNPGKDVDKFNGATDAFATHTGTCTGPGPTGGNNAPAPTGGNSTPAPTAAPVPTTNYGGQPQPTAAPSTAPGNGSGSGSGDSDGSNGTPQVPGGAFITVSQPVASQPTATQAPAASETPDNGSGNGGSGSDSGSGGGSGSGSGGFAAGTACTNEGEWNCIGGSTFQRCASGAWTTAQQLSSGVTCTPGQAADIAMTAKRGNRSMRRAQRIQA